MMSEFNSVDEMLTYLQAHPGMIYVLPNRMEATFYWSVMDSFMVVSGDFSGPDEHVQRELRKAVLAAISPFN